MLVVDRCLVEKPELCRETVCQRLVSRDSWGSTRNGRLAKAILSSPNSLYSQKEPHHPVYVNNDV